MTPILSVQDVSLRYGRKVALDHVSFTIEPGQIVGLLGPNGAGKTTLIKIVNTLLTTHTGTVLINGEPLGVRSKELVSYLPDVEFLRDDFKISTLIKLYKDFYSLDFDEAKALDMLKLVQLDPNTRVRSLSKGMKERLQLVLVMSRNAALYIFDEPIAGVDPAARDFILETIIRNYNQNGAILLSTHLITDVEPVISRAIFIKEGRITLDEDADTLREARGQSIDAIFREEFRC